MSKTRIDPDLYERFYAQADRVRAREDEKSRDSQIKRETVYTPVECVDFINQSVADILMREFGVSMNDERVEVLDPFAGTGIFLARAEEAGLIDPARQSVHQIELVQDSAEISARNVPGANTHCADTFALDPRVDLGAIPTVDGDCNG